MITNAYLPDKDSPGGLCANLAQRDHLGKTQIISHASRQLRENEKNYTRFLLETAAAAWGMDNFNEYLKGSRFTLYRDRTTETTLGTTQLKTLNRLRNTMIEHDFEIQDRQKADLPDFLKKRQIEEETRSSGQDQAFNKVIHVDLIKADPHNTTVPEQAILSITDDTRTFSQVTVLTDDKIDAIAVAIWHHWCQPYGHPETILSNQGKVWTSKLGSRINNVMPLEQRIHCRSEKKIFNPEVRQQWQQNQPDTSADEFAQHWNFLYNFQSPAKFKTGSNNLDEVDQNLDDIEDFVEEEPNIPNNHFEVLGQNKLLVRKSISLCRHKLQARAYPKVKKAKTILRQPERPMKTDDLDHEWLQLIQMEKAIEEKRNQLQGTEAQNRWNPDEDHETFWDDEQNEHLDDGDLEYINDILNSFSKPSHNHENSRQLKFESVNQEDALARAFASPKTPKQFNLKFNQNSTTSSSKEDKFSHFSNIEEERTSELGDYFSDDKEDDTWDKEDITSKSNSWSQPDLNESEEDFPLSQPTLYEWDPVISGLESIHEARFEDDGETNKLNHISGLSAETQLSFSTWQPFIPLKHAFLNCAAQSQPSGFLSQASSLQELTLTRISTISTSTKRTSSPIGPTSPRLKIDLRKVRRTECPDLSKPPSQQLRTKPCKPFYLPTYSATPTPKLPFFTDPSKMSALPNHELPDHPEQSKRNRLCKQQSQGSTKTNQNQSTTFRSTPQATDAGSEPQECTQLKSQSYSTMKSRRNTTGIKSGETKWPKFSSKTPTYQTKSQKNTKPHQKNSKRIQFWPWSRGQSPPTCSLHTAKTVKNNQNTNCLHGKIHSSISRTKQQNTNTKPEWPDPQNQARQPRRR